MSEKLSRCRKELTAAIDRAMEDLAVSFPPSPNSAIDQNLQAPPMNVDLFSQKSEPPSSTICCHQVSLPVSPVPEKENILFGPNLIPVTIASNISYVKREPLTSKENTWLHAPVFMADRQYFISPEDNERWRKGHLSKTDEKLMKTETSATACNNSSESLKDLANTNERRPSKSDFENKRQFSNEMFPLDETTTLGLHAKSSFQEALEYTLEDEAIIETLLDMEEDYNPNSSTLH